MLASRVARRVAASIAQGSLGEVDYSLLLARDLRYATPDQIAPLRAELNEIGAMLHALRRKASWGRLER